MARILIVSDVHADPWALEAIERDAGAVDRVFCIGDSVSYGPAPRAVLAWLGRSNAAVVQGNHDYAVALDRDPRAAPAKRELALALRDWTRAQLGPGERDYLASLPRRLAIEYGGCRFLLIHGSPKDELFDYRLTPQAPQELVDEIVAGTDADLLLLGHTHLPMDRRSGSLRIVNPGSAGQPLDGDPRACYAIWEDGQVRLARTAYSTGPMLDAIASSDLPASARSQLSEIMLHASLSPRGAVDACPRG